MLKELIKLLPRFQTEYVALEEVDEQLEYSLLASEIDLTKDKIPDGVVLVKSFTFLGFGFFPQPVSEVYTWKEYTQRRPYIK